MIEVNLDENFEEKEEEVGEDGKVFLVKVVMWVKFEDEGIVDFVCCLYLVVDVKL